MTQEASSAEALERAWSGPSGFRGFLSATTHKQIGLRYIVTALAFFIIAGSDSLVIRGQLTFPDNDLVSAGTFNQLFTTHGTAMMFLFAVPMLEGIGSYLIPLMLGTRDMPYPRLNAFGYWTYLFGGLLLYASTLPDVVNFVAPGDPLQRQVPDTGWFAYPPLTLTEFSPDRGMDFWLLGVTLAEISAITFAIDTVAAIFFTRARGMSLPRIPVFVWAMLVMSIAILFAFPSVIVASLLVEVERQFGWPFFAPALGGDPLLWQHLFWIFGHPEVYIMFIPATGIISMIVPVFAGRSLSAYTFVVAAIIATGFLSFGLWVHHMFAVGIPWLALSFFGVSSMMITIPSGVQVFAWIATMLQASIIRLTTPMLFAMGFIVTFVIGGITGVMVASVPFDLQVHDTYFVVAHFHYVLIGGVVFPILGAIHYWMPKVTGKELNEKLGKWTFWLWFLGFNIAFLPQHTLGLMGMPRRAYTYLDLTSFTVQNMISTAGAFMMAAATVVLLANLGRALIRGERSKENPWNANSLEWATPSPPPAYNFLHQPAVTSRDPMWQASIATVSSGGWADAGTRTLPREMLGTSLLDAEPITAIRVANNSFMPLVVALAAAVAAVGLLFSLYALFVLGVVAAAIGVFAWLRTDEDERNTTHSGPSLPIASMPVQVTGPRSTAWWAMALSILALTVIAANFLFAYFYLAYGSADWPPDGIQTPSAGLGVVGTLIVALAATGMHMASAAVARGRHRLTRSALAATTLLGAALVVVTLVWFLSSTGDPTETAYSAIVLAFGSLLAVLGLVALVANGLVQYEEWRYGYTAQRRVALQNTAMFWDFLAGIWIAGAAIVLLVPEI